MCVKYEVSQVNGKNQIKVNQQKWAEADTSALLPLIQAGFYLPGFVGNLVDEGILEIGRDKLGLPTLTLEAIVQDSIRELQLLTLLVA